MSREKDLKQSLSWAIEVLRVRHMNPLQLAYLEVIRDFARGLSIQTVALPEKEYELVSQALATQRERLIEAVEKRVGFSIVPGFGVETDDAGQFVLRKAVIEILNEVTL